MWERALSSGHGGLERELLLSAMSLADALIESAPDGLLLVDETGVIVVANPAAAQIFGYPVDDLVGMRVEALVPAEQRARHVAHRKVYGDAPVSRPMGSGLRLLAEHADGGLFPVEISLSPVELGDDRRTIAAVRDVSQRQNDRARIVLMDERERIARDLHDTVIQQLFAAGMTLQAIASTAGADDVAERLHDIAGQLDDTITEIRGSIFRLGQQPAGAPLSERIASLVDERVGRVGLQPQLVLDDGIDDQPEALAEHVLATLSEALSNVVRHADATAVSVSLRCADKALELIVTDDGVGPSAAPIGGRGLANMAHRAEALGGTCTIGPAASNGTNVLWSVPVGS